MSITGDLRQHDNLFVYGTLRSECDGHMARLLRDHSRFIGSGTFQGKLFLIEDYPGAVPSNDPSDEVRGDIYDVDNAAFVFHKLDEYEECFPSDANPPLFRRERHRITIDGGEGTAAWIYLYNRPIQRQERISSGDYRDRPPAP